VKFMNFSLVQVAPMARLPSSVHRVEECKLLKIKWQKNFFLFNVPRLPSFYACSGLKRREGKKKLLCVFITQHKLHESMQNSLRNHLSRLTHTHTKGRKKFLASLIFVRETNLFEETRRKLHTARIHHRLL
jgi:hypothetical protein